MRNNIGIYTKLKKYVVRNKVIQTKYTRGAFNILKPIPCYLENLFLLEK